MYRYRRSSPVLPDPDTLPFPARAIVACDDCHLRKGCTRPVPGVGPIPSRVMIVGQNPGRNEDLEGKPFIGAAGQQLDSLLFRSGVSRDDIYITNVVHCLTPNNRELQLSEIKACSRWVNLETQLVDPDIIVAMGGPAIRHFLDTSETVEHLHGHPVRVNVSGRERIILPTYHPAAALHQTDLLRLLNEDFQVLRGIVRGDDPERYIVQDEYPHPVYCVADTPKKLRALWDEINAAGEFAVDVETVDFGRRIWSVQISTAPGTAWFIPVSPEEGVHPFDLSHLNATAIVHYYLNDINYLRLPDRFLDTMVMAYLLNLPQGLKQLAYRMCGIHMVNYNEVVRPGQRKLSLDYLHQAARRTWGDPPAISETKWDNRQGRIVTRMKRPWHISRKINNLLAQAADSDEVDLLDKWQQIDAAERAEVERVLGPMPESSLADIPLDRAVEYACRDADATMRVSRVLMERIREMGLEFVLHMDLDILPMVNDMMRRGMPVNVDHFRQLSADFGSRMEAKAAELASLVGHSFNPNSSDQVAAVVYGELGFVPGKRTPSGEVSTDDEELKKCKGPDGKVSPVSRGIIQYRQLSKLKGTYADNIIRSSHPDETGQPCLHTKLNTTRVATGRLSSSKLENGEGANLQNIPTRSKEGKQIKSGFVAHPGWVLAEGDYSQIEMVTLTHLSGCRRLTELFLRNGDPHTEMARTIFGVPLEMAKQSKYRYPMKRVNFGIAYKIGARGLADQLLEYAADLEMAGEPVDIELWDEATCQKFLDEWYHLNPEVREFQDEQGAKARRLGYVSDMFGRIRYIPEVTSPIESVREAGLRQAANMPVTASAQGIIKLAMGELWRQLPYSEWAGKLHFLMQIHDSLVMEIVDDPAVVKGALRWVRSIMTGVVKLRVPVKADYKVGPTWGSLAGINLDEEEKAAG